MSSSSLRVSTRRREVPVAGPGPGSLYVIQFDNDVIKVGRTADAHVRRTEHARDAARFGLSIKNMWSAPVKNATWAEELLVRRLNSLGRRTAGREYFRSIPFTIARHLAEGSGFKHESVPCCCGKCVGLLQFTLSAVVVTHALFNNSGSDPQAQFRLAHGDLITGTLSDPDYAETGQYPLKPGQRVEIEFERGSVPDDDWQIWAVTEQA